MAIRPAKLSWTKEWLTNAEQLPVLAERLATKKILSIDTETAGWQTGNERLCLVQIGIPDEKAVVLIDTLSVGDLKPLEAVLANRNPGLIAHNAQFEERQFARYGIKLRGVIDTLTLARKLRADLPNHTLQTCCRHLLDIEVVKEEQTSDWSLRPLSTAQIEYAALDAEIAYQLYEVLAELEARLQIPANAKVPDLMADLAKTTQERLRLTSEIAPQLAFLNAREELLRETIRTQLINGEPAYDGSFGACKVTRVKRTEINPIKVRQEFPDFAAEVISEYVERARFLAVLKENGLDDSVLEKVADIVGYTDRLSLSLADVGE